MSQGATVSRHSESVFAITCYPMGNIMAEIEVTPDNAVRWLADAVDLIRECRLADAHAARTGDELRWDQAFLALCQFERTAKPVLARLQSTPDIERDRLADFGARMFDAIWERFTDAGFEMEINDLVTIDAVRAGLVEQTEFDPDEHDDPSGACYPGDDYFLITDTGRAALKRARQALTKGSSHAE